MAENQELWLSILSAAKENKIRFNPIRGTQNAIAKIGYSDGNIYFATDTKMIWLDTYITNPETQQPQLTRILMGNGTGGGGEGNTGFIYANADFVAGTLEQINADEPFYYILKDAFDSNLQTLPIPDTLIINSNGWFFRVTEQGVGDHDDRVIAQLISSGTGGGEASQASDILIKLLTMPSSQFIDGQEAWISFIPYAARNRQGRVLDDYVYVDWKLSYTEDGEHYIQYASGTLDVLPTDEEATFEFGTKAKLSSRSRLSLTVRELNSTKTDEKVFAFTTSKLELSLPSSFSNISPFDSEITLSCYQDGEMNKMLDFYWDEMLIEERVLGDNSEREQTLKVREALTKKNLEITHGYHLVKIVLSQYLEGKRGFSTTPLEFEVAIYEANNNTPIIWLGNYSSSYYNYDRIQIPFRVYDPRHSEPEIHLYKEGKEIESSPRTIKDSTKFSTFEIVDFDLNMQNFYSITCEDEDDPENTVQRDIEFLVTQDPNRRDFDIQKKDYLTLNFDASGRSNSESLLKRASWSYELNNQVYNAVFENFNWYNNGWITENNKTCLRISNGAKFKIPIGTTVFAGSNNNELSHSFEFQFKIKNVQDYSNLIRNITRYENDEVYYNAFYDSILGYKTEYTNYDAFLSNYFKTHNVSYTDPKTNETRNMEYDDLVFNKVEKQINLSSVACGYYTGTNASVVGICLGPQDAFFSNGTNTVNVNYVEDEIINLTAVYSNDSQLMYIYINGVLTGIIAKSTTGPFSINTDNIVFSSDYCDIDLYKIRIYDTALNVNDVVTNFAVDLKDVLIYDQNKLAFENSALQEFQLSYQRMIEYNMNHINSPIMPYIIFDTSKSNNNDRLSYSKAYKVNIGVEFVNTPLELAYTSGELETLSGPEGDKLWNLNSTPEQRAAAVKSYYQHHCPSWKGENISMAVQGTSSEFYPRRNYKLKTKGDDGVNIFLHKGPFAVDYEKDPESTRQPYWYMDNYTAGTTKFTMKIDYMESSGTYNMGFANLVKNAYSKHPFDDLNNNNAFTTDETVYTVATEYQEGITYWYKNQKGKWKNSKDDELTITSEEHFNKGPVARNAELGLEKVLTDTSSSEYNKWYTANTEYVNYNIPNTSSYRTSVQGFRTLAFHKKSDGSYTYIGMYNMLLDKGSDEVYGFKPDKTTGKNVYQKYLNNKEISKIAECWEFENNSRTFCSFRDPMNRKDLSFNVYTTENGEKKAVKNSVNSAPIVADSFEYRYHTDADILDYVYDPDKNGDKLESEDTVSYMNKNNVNLAFDKNRPDENYSERANVIFNAYKNWEKAVAWVWSTNTDSVGSQGAYVQTNVGTIHWEPNKFWVFENNKYILDTGASWDNSKIYYNRIDNYEEISTGDEIDDTIDYYIKDGSNYTLVSEPSTNTTYYLLIPIYQNAHVSDNIYEPNKYYNKVNNDYVISLSEDFDETLTYYELQNYSDDQLASGVNGITYDRLVQQCSDSDDFNSDEPYYTYNGENMPGQAVIIAQNLTQEEFNNNKTNYYKGITVTYKGKEYRFDTKEYRADKFINDLNKHFDIEYLSTYFVMTEVFECYDSRGKNAMFASWGPQEEGGDYIWYPIFYDIDTQLGINNTGIPSFEFNVDATENNNFSTSDSILWNNFYKYFKSSRILMKYKHLKGITSGVTWDQLNNPPLQSVNNIEAWYQTNSNVCNSIAMRGVRPLIATNLDEFYKYITITNTYAEANGVGRVMDDGTIQKDEGTYFYALQGDRSLSRRQFLSNRLEYIDSWLNQGNYARGGNNRMWGRIAANNPVNTSDFWVEDMSDLENTSYYLSDGITKRHAFDAEYWLNLTPMRSTYVTLGDDNEAYPSRKYDGITPVHFEIGSIEKGVRRSANYPEQLLYVYGINQMTDVGDMSRLYWQEFKIEGEAKHLTRLLLGSDEVIQDTKPGSNVEENITWHNQKMNPPTIPSSASSSGMPLLKEVNFSNIQISKEPRTLNFTSCEKLQNFRATGSNLTEVRFAEGVALNTLYLPNSITTLELIEARLLTKLLTQYTPPEKQSNGNLTVEPGLYIENLFDGNRQTSINTLNIVGGSLGYDSYKLLKQLYDVRGGSQPRSIAYINMIDVNWCPYTLVEPDEAYNNSNTYKKIDNHYGLEDYSYDEGNWKNDVINQEIYKLTINDSNIYNQITDIDMLSTFITNANYQEIGGTSNTVPKITGIIYINNTDPVDESYIRNTLQVNFPQLTFFFNNVTKRPTARFIYLEDNGNIYHYIKDNPLSIQTLSSNTDSEQWFKNPITTYVNLDKFLPHYDFYGWAIQDDSADVNSSGVYTIGYHKYKLVVSNDSADTWTRPLGTLATDYTFYAIFTQHKYLRRFYNKIEDIEPLASMKQTYSERVQEPKEGSNILIPSLDLDDPDGDDLFYVNKFEGWALKRQPGVVVDLNKLSGGQDYDFVAVYEEVDVHNNILDEKYLEVDEDSEGRVVVGLKQGYKLKGKITIPATIKMPDSDEVRFIDVLGAWQDSEKTFSPILRPNEITHIFFARNSQISIIGDGFYDINQQSNTRHSTLRYIEPLSSIVEIGQAAFRYCTSMRHYSHLDELLQNVRKIGSKAFERVGTPATSGEDTSNNPITLKLPGHDYDEFSNTAFDQWRIADTLIIGDSHDPCLWFKMLDAGIISESKKIFSNFGVGAPGSIIKKIHIYISSDVTETQKENLLKAFSFDTSSFVWSNDVTNAAYSWITVVET